MAILEPDAQGPDIPRAVVGRIVKQKLQELAAQGPAPAAGEKSPGVPQVKPDALLALQESAKVFISFIASTANDFAKEGKRQTIGTDDVFKALEDLEFTELVQPLRDYLEAQGAGLKEQPKKQPKDKAVKEKGTASRKRKGAKGELGQAGDTKRSALPPQPPQPPPPKPPPPPSTNADEGAQQQEGPHDAIEDQGAEEAGEGKGEGAQEDAQRQEGEEEGEQEAQ